MSLVVAGGIPRFHALDAFGTGEISGVLMHTKTALRRRNKQNERSTKYDSFSNAATRYGAAT